MKIVDSSVKEEKMELEVGKWDKLKNWDKVQGDIGEMLKNVEKFDDSMTLYYGPQLYHTLRHPAHIKCMTHFTSNIGENFVSHYRLGTQDQLGVWTLKSVEPGAKCENQRFNITGEVKAFLFIPKHRTYMCFCSDLVMRMYTDVHSNCTESWSQQCLTTVRCTAYNRETDDVYVGGVGVLQKWKISGAEHSAKAEPGDIFNTDLQNDEWVIDIKVDTRNKQLMAVTYEGIYVVNYETMRQTHHLENRHGNSLRCCCFYKDREYFITGGGDGAIKVWNAVVFTQVHVFYGHHDVITALQTHKTDPLLFSSSLDGSVQIWRMDNFSKFMRLDLGDKIYSMKLIGDEEFYCQTENQIKIYSLNQFYNLFAPVESSVYKLQLSSGVKGHPSRIIASTEDGSVRLFSPVTGATLTIIYPMPTFQVLSCFAYSRENNRLHSVLQNGEVLLFNCDTNPCRAVEVWIPQTSDEEVLQIVQLTLAYEKEEVMVTDTVILGGMRNGQICLLEAEQCVMIKNVQAHVGTITCMEGATDIGMTGFKLLETNRKLATGGDDLFIKIWEIGVKANELFDSIFIQLLIKIPCVGMPEHICMYENTISVSTSDDSDKGKLHMYRLDGQESKEIQITTLQHTQDEDHTEHITAIDKCPLLGLFATASEDGYIKIWNRHNQLIREMGFGEPMHGLCFANIRGDILIGFQNHICTIPLTSYFPKNYLERITRQEFKDEVRETPLAYNHRIKPWFDPEALPKFSLSLTKRTEEKKPVEKEDILEDLELTPRVPLCNPDIKIEEVIVKQDFIEIPAVTKSFQASYVKEVQKESNKKVEKIAKHTGMVEDDTVFDRGYSAPTPVPAKRMRIEKAREERRKSDTLYFEKLSQWERDLFNRKPIIAPDGYIPNSAVRKELGYVAPSSPLRKKKDTWTIQSIKVPAPPVTKTQEEQAEEDHHWEEDFRPLSWGDNDDGRRSTNSTTPWRKMSNFIRASSTLSNQSTSSSKRGPKGRRQSTPTTPKYELKSKKFDLHRLDLDMGTPDRMRRSLGTKSRERTKSSFRLTNMVVDEQSTNVTFKDDSKSGHRKGMLPAVDMDVVRQLMDDLFPDLHGTASFDSILQNLIRMLDTEDEDLHKKICDYIISIHRDIGIQDHYLDRIISKLSVQLSGDNHSFKMDALSTLKVIGVDRQDVLAIILPRLIDSQEDIREQAKEVLAALCGVVNKDELLELMNSMGMTKQFDTKEAEEEALKELAMRLDVPYRSDSFADWINNWVDDTSSLYDSEPEVKLDDIDKAWDGRQRKWKPESLYLTESASRASTRMRELSFLSKGSRTPIQELDENDGELLDIEDLEKIKTQGQLSDRSSRSSNRSRRGVKFDPRDPSLYRYYKNRHIKERENDGKFNYKNMSKYFSKTQLGAGEDTDSQIGSMDSHSQVGDTLSTNDSGIISIQDSGIGRDMSDTYSYKSYKASPFLSKEKIEARAASYRPRQESHRKHNLSPVKSSSTIGGGSAKSTPREKEPDWMKFFQTPTALERKRMEMVKREYNEGKMKPGSALVVNYISEGLPMLPGEAGLRLLKSVKVGRHKGSLPPAEERHHMIESIPGKLGVHTKDEDKGQSKYGILQMQWTTAIPAPVSRNHYPERYSAMSGMSDATSELGGSTVRSVQSKCHLPAIIEKYGRSERTDTTEMTDFPHLPGGIYTPDYKWDYPIPPPPAKESRISIPYIKKEHERYCKYYTLVKKKMQNYTSKTRGSHTMKSSLPKVEIKKAIPEKLKLPKELTHLSRVSSVLFPPITLNQLMSARS